MVPQVVAQHIRGAIPAGKDDVWSNIGFVLPLGLPPSKIVNCSFIDIEYLFEVSAKSKHKIVFTVYIDPLLSLPWFPTWA